MKKPTAIVYTSKMGHTKKYAEIIAEKTGLSAYSLNEAEKTLAKGCEIIYLGWIHASNVKGFSSALKRFTVSAVCGVGLCDTGALLDEVRAKTKIPAEIPLFTLQGGMDTTQLKGMDKMLISMLIKGLESTKEPTEDDKHMLELMKNNANFVSEENLSDFLDYFSKNLS